VLAQFAGSVLVRFLLGENPGLSAVLGSFCFAAVTLCRFEVLLGKSVL
jgi:hypothetical protein